MWLMNAYTHRLEEFHGNDKPQYAILSHTWEGEEVSFLDVRDSRHRDLRGWAKIEACCKQALVDGYEYLWADTCCIDKRNIVDLSEALNSMFRWYKEAAVCYTYLADVQIGNDHNLSMLSDDKTAARLDQWHPGGTMRDEFTTTKDIDGQGLAHCENDGYSVGSRIVASRWFTRGWTLQELLAPKSLVFYDASWTLLGTRFDCVAEIEQRTSIPQAALQGFVLEDYCIAQKMAWAAGRQTTRPEDRAYSLLGLLGVSLSLIYGEGEEEAFIRLQRKLIKRLDDTSLLAWNRKLSTRYSHWLLAPSSDAFEGCHVFQEYRSCAYGIDLSKTVLAGAFDFHIDSFDVGYACLGHFEPCVSNHLPGRFEDNSDWRHVNSVGMMLVDLRNGSHQCAIANGKQRVLFDCHDSHAHNAVTRKQLRINPVAPELSRCSLWQSYRPHYPLRGDESSGTQICPAQLCPEGEKERREDELRRALLGGYELTARRISPRHNGPFVLQPSHEREVRCFVICRPKIHWKGMIVTFSHDLNGRPVIRDGLLEKAISDVVLDYGTFQTMDSTDGIIEIAARGAYSGKDGQLSMNMAREWANSAAFHQLIPGDYHDGNNLFLPGGTRVLQLGDNIKVVFLPQGNGHRVLFALRGTYRGFWAFPRAWLWPISEEEKTAELMPKHHDAGLKTKFKGLFR